MGLYSMFTDVCCVGGLGCSLGSINKVSNYVYRVHEA